ncbi:MAG: hypothetical protein IPN34_07590 [Planctomycetes bacterium]|nr:hypothetical protein [Planctomycetota bacterium]
MTALRFSLRASSAALLALCAAPAARAQASADELYVGGFPFDGEPAFPGLLSRASGSFRNLAGRSSETLAVSAARIDRFSGELVITGLQSEGVGSSGALIELGLDARGVHSERVLSAGDPRSAVRAFGQDADGGWICAGFEGVERRRRSDGCAYDRFDLPARTWNALAIRPDEERAFVASFGDGGEIWELDLRTRGMRLLLRLADFGWPATITALWIDPEAPAAPLWIATLEARASLLALDLAQLALAPHPAAPPHGLNALEGTRDGRLYLLGSGESSSDVQELELASGTTRIVHAAPQLWSGSALALPPAPGEVVIYPRTLAIDAPQRLELAAYVPPGAPAALWIVALRMRGVAVPLSTPVLEGLVGTSGALRAAFDLGAGAFDGLLPGDGMLWQLFWLEPTTLEPRFSAPRWTLTR